MSDSQKTDTMVRQEEKKQKRMIRRKKRRKFFKRFFLLLLVVIIVSLAWRAFTYDGLPGEIDREDVAIIASALGDPYYTHQLPSGNKELDSALESRDKSVRFAMGALNDLYTESLAINQLWPSSLKEAGAVASSLTLSTSEEQMLHSLSGIEASNIAYLEVLTAQTSDLLSTEASDPLNASKKDFDLMMNSLLLAERHAEQFYLSVYRQAFLDNLAQTQQQINQWQVLNKLSDQFAQYHNQYLYVAELMAFIDTGDYYLTGFYLEETQETLQKLDQDLNKAVSPYFETMKAAHEKPLNYISIESIPEPTLSADAPFGSVVYAKDIGNQLNDAKNVYDTSDVQEKPEYKMSAYEARAAILDMCVPGASELLPFTYEPKPKPKETEDPFGDLMMELILNAPINKNAANSVPRTDIQQNIQQLETKTDVSSNLQNELFNTNAQRTQRDPAVEALLQKLNDQKAMEALINMIKEKQASSKDPVNDLVALGFDFFKDLANNQKGNNQSSNVRFATLLNAMSEQLNKYGSTYLSKEQLVYANNFIKEDLNNLSDADKTRAFLAFQSLNPEKLLNDIKLSVADMLGLEDVINEIMNAILSIFTLGFVDFDIEVSNNLSNVDYDSTATSNAYWGNPTGMNGEWTGSGSTENATTQSDIESLPTGSTYSDSDEPLQLTVNRNGSHYTVSVPFNMGNISSLIESDDQLQLDPREIAISSVECLLKGKKLSGSTTKSVSQNGQLYDVSVTIDGNVNDSDGTIRGKMITTVKISGLKNLVTESQLDFNVSGQ